MIFRCNKKIGMPIRKPSPIQRIGPAGNLPKQFPRMQTSSTGERYKEVEAYNNEVAEWWYDTMSVIQAGSQEIRDLLNQAAIEIATLKAQQVGT